MCLCRPSGRTRPRGHTDLFAHTDRRQCRAAWWPRLLGSMKLKADAAVRTQGAPVPTAVGRPLSRAVPAASLNGRLWRAFKRQPAPPASSARRRGRRGLPGLSVRVTLPPLRPAGRAVRSLDPPHPPRPRPPPHSPLSSRTGSPSAAIFSSEVQTHRK
jgi:hypothetical protein